MIDRYTMTQVVSTGDFISISPSEFFYRNRQMAGFGNPTQAVYSTVRELVENSLDACEDAQKLPVIDVRIRRESSDIIQLSVSDNGTGIPEEHVPNAFGRIFYGSKYGMRQKRGTFGLGVTMAVLYGQLTTDSPVTVSTQMDEGHGLTYKIFIDVEKNEPIIESKHLSRRSGPGTDVSIRLNGDVRRAKSRIIEYLRMTAVSSPHARIILEFEDHDHLHFGGSSTTLPSPSLCTKPHPRGVDRELLRRLLADRGQKSLIEFLIDSFQQVGDRTARRFLRFMALDPKIRADSLTREDLSRLSNTLRRFDGFSRPDSRCLSPIGEFAFKEAVSAEFGVDVLTYAKQGPLEWEGHPLLIEGVIATDNGASQSEIPSLHRFANKVPLLYDASEGVLMKTLRKVTWSRYEVEKSKTVSLFVNVCSTRIPYIAAGKHSIASSTQIEDGALSLFRELGRQLGKSAVKSSQSKRNARRMREFTRSFKIIAKFSAELANRATPPSTVGLVKSLFEVDDHD